MTSYATSYAISYAISCAISCAISYAMLLWCTSDCFFFLQDTLCLVAPYPFRLEPLEDFDPLVDFDMTGVMMFGLQGHSYFSHAAYAPLDVRKTSLSIGRFRWWSSTHLNQYLSPQTVSCRGEVSPWFTSGRPASFQHSMSALWNSFSAESHSFRATLRGTVTRLFRSASDTMFPMVLLLIPGKTGDRQPAFRGQHLDVALRKVISKKGFGHGCSRDAAGARSRIKA